MFVQIEEDKCKVMVFLYLSITNQLKEYIPNQLARSIIVPIIESKMPEIFVDNLRVAYQDILKKYWCKKRKMEQEKIHIQIDGVWFDFTGFKHPGGSLKKYNDKDCTDIFNSIKEHNESFVDEILRQREMKKKEWSNKIPFFMKKNGIKNKTSD